MELTQSMGHCSKTAPLPFPLVQILCIKVEGSEYLEVTNHKRIVSELIQVTAPINNHHVSTQVFSQLSINQKTPWT